MARWAQIFCETLPCSPVFRETLERGLQQQTLERVGLDLDQGFFLVPPEPEAAVRFDAQGVGHLAAELVAPDAFAHPVELAWRSTGHPGRPVRPAEATAEDRLEIWWESFPADELRARYGEPGEPPWPVSKDFVFVPSDLPFTVEWRPFPWPSVWLELETGGGPRPEEIEQALLGAREAWNAQPRDRGIIHDLSELRPLAPGRWEIHIDFGSAGPNALVTLLDALREEPFGIRRVAVRGYPAADPA